MSYHNDKNENQSRRQVQRRFPPGSWAVNEKLQLILVVAWTQTPPKVNPRTGVEWQPQSWEATIIQGTSRIDHESWTSMRRMWSLEEWESA